MSCKCQHNSLRYADGRTTTAELAPALYDLYPFIIHTMQAISTGCSEHGDWSWDPDTVTKANGFLHHITTFEFLVSFSVAMRLLSSLRGLTIKLQKQSKDILQAYE